jgi:hypothetical protein
LISRGNDQNQNILYETRRARSRDRQRLAPSLGNKKCNIGEDLDTLDRHLVVLD